MGTKCCPNFQKLFLYALLINYYCFVGHSSRSKRCFTKMEGIFLEAFIPFPFENVGGSGGGKKYLHRTSWESPEKNSDLNISLPDWMQMAASLRSFLICLRFRRATWPLHAAERDTECAVADQPLCNKIDGHALHQIPLQNMAKPGGRGMDPFELSVVLLCAPKRCT